MCFDFTVRFSESSKENSQDIEKNIWKYFDKNQEFFQSQGYKKYDPKLSLGSVTMGKLIQTQSKEQIIDMISKHQCLKSIKVL
jgi:hypothetical protein